MDRVNFMDIVREYFVSSLTPVILIAKKHYAKLDNMNIKSNEKTHKNTCDIPSRIEWE